MMRALFLSLLLALSAAPAFAIDITQFDDPAQQERYLKLTHELRCMQCLNTSIADSQVDLAADLRREVHDLVAQGKSDDEIRKYMVDRYGEFILFRPLTNARNMWLWLAPSAFLLIGAVVAVRILRQRSKLVEQDHEPIEGDTER
ncbi:MAG: cytochrome c-type biogenesis protein [Gammaproteobacteria bacterium]